MSQIVIGKSEGKNVAIDRRLLMTTRLLITADSGGGKTWLIKRLIEQAFGQVGIIIIDPEGEFSPLRAKFDFFLVGKGGDTPADIRTAEKVAQTLLAGRASAVCDIYDMKDSERHIWVQRFLDSLLNAPKELRHPYFVIVDESQMFCPEHGKGESVASDAMRGLAGRGRKRMLCGIYATQRLAMVSKDLTGMCLNRLIGPTFEKPNQKAAADQLGISENKKERDPFYSNIKMLEPGNFYALGRAITKEVKLVHVGPIETPHGHEALKYELKPPPPSDRVRAWLKEIGDLPEQAEEEAKTVAGLTKQLREAKSALRKAGNGASVNSALTTVNKNLRSAKIVPDKRLAPMRALLELAMKMLVKVQVFGFEDSTLKPEELTAALELAAKEVSRRADAKLKTRSKEFDALKREVAKIVSQMKKFTDADGEDVVVDVAVRREVSASVLHETATPKPQREVEAIGEITRPQVRILTALAEFAAIERAVVSKKWVAARAGASHKSSAFKNNLSALNSAGLTDRHGSESIGITEAGLEKVPHVEPPGSPAEMLSSCMNVLSGSRPQQRILQTLYDSYPNTLDKDSLAAAAQASPTSSAFKNNLSALRSAGMIEASGDDLKCSAWILLQ